MRPPIPRVGMRWRSPAIGQLVLSAIAVGAVRADAATYPDPGVVTGAISGVHDPSMIKAPNGTYILVSTGDWLEIRTSADRTTFTKVGSEWAAGQPTWTSPYPPASGRAYLWAPDISYHNGQYYLCSHRTNSRPTNGKLGINLLGWDSSGWPYVY